MSWVGVRGRDGAGGELQTDTAKQCNQRACVMMSDVCAVLIQVNPAGTSTYGGRAQPSSHILMPYSGQIKG